MQESKQYDKMINNPIPKLIIRLGIPTTISMLITSIYNLADTHFVGEYGNSASGAVGVVFGLMALIQSFGFMFGQGSGAICAQALGARKTDKATRYASTGFFAALATGLLITVFGLMFINPLMYLLGSTDTILPYARTYAFYILCAAPVMCSSCVLNNVLRFEGQASFAMIGLASGGLINIFGDWLLIQKLHMGVAGAGIATAISQYISFFLLLSMFLRGKTSSKIALRHITRKFSELLEICKVGFPSMVRQGLSSISTMLLNNQAGIYGDAAIAAMSVTNRICFFTFATALGIGQGFQPVSAFNYGAKKYNRVRKAFLFTLSVGALFLCTVAIVGLQFTAPLISLFRQDDDVIRIGQAALTYQFIGQLFLPISVCSNMLFQSVGKVRISTFLSMLRSGLFFLPILMILSTWWGLPGVQSAQAISDVLSALVALPFTIQFLRELKHMETEIK